MPDPGGSARKRFSLAQLDAYIHAELAAIAAGSSETGQLAVDQVKITVLARSVANDGGARLEMADDARTATHRPQYFFRNDPREFRRVSATEQET